MVQYLRQKNLPAYTFNKGEQERNALNEELERQRQQQQAANPLVPVRRKIIRIEDQVAVLVGGYPDEKTAHQGLETTIKKLPPPQLRVSAGTNAEDVLFVPTEDGLGHKRVSVNPFTTAFVTRNPVAEKKVAVADPLWWKLNQYEKYSLLESKKPLTLLVKQYSGAGGLVQADGSKGFLDKMGPSKNAKFGDALNAAAMQAHELARVLRELNFQAYVLHTSNCSLVTVGELNSLEDPEYKRVTQQLAALQQRFSSGGYDPLKLNPLPVPMSVPRKTNQ
jgi:hypothetical protein